MTTTVITPVEEPENVQQARRDLEAAKERFAKVSDAVSDLATAKADLTADLRSAESRLAELLLAQFLSEPADGISEAEKEVEALRGQLANYEIIEPFLEKEIVKWESRATNHLSPPRLIIRHWEREQEIKAQEAQGNFGRQRYFI